MNGYIFGGKRHQRTDWTHVYYHHPCAAAPFRNQRSRHRATAIGTFKRIVSSPTDMHDRLVHGKHRVAERLGPVCGGCQFCRYEVCAVQVEQGRGSRGLMVSSSVAATKSPKKKQELCQSGGMLSAANRGKIQTVSLFIFVCKEKSQQGQKVVKLSDEVTH